MCLWHLVWGLREEWGTMPGQWHVAWSQAQSCAAPCLQPGPAGLARLGKYLVSSMQVESRLPGYLEKKWAQGSYAATASKLGWEDGAAQGAC